MITAKDKFKSWGPKTRKFPECNYNAVWYNLKTIRLGKGQATELPADSSEFYDVSIGNKCNLNCKFCYVSASSSGHCYESICSTWIKLMGSMSDNQKCFQIAIGSEGEPTIHPEFCKFLETVYDTGVVPNYTTNGVILSELTDESRKILDYTSKYVGGVAVSFGNKSVRSKAIKAVDNLIEYGNTLVNLHHIISTKESVDELIEIVQNYGNKVHYHVLLPLMPSGRSTEKIEEGVFEYLEDKIISLGLKNVAFGAHFIDNLMTSKLKTWNYPPESMSKNMLLKKDEVIITPSSFNLTPLKVIKF